MWTAPRCPATSPPADRLQELRLLRLARRRQLGAAGGRTIGFGLALGVEARAALDQPLALPRLPLNRELVTVKTDCELPVGPSQLALEAPDIEALRLVPRELCRKRRVVPLEMRGGPEHDDKELWLAMADPTDTAAITAIERVTGAVVDVALLPLSAIDELIEQGEKQLSTQVVRRGKPYGGGVVVATQPHARTLTDDTVETTSTSKLRLVELPGLPEPDLKLQALIKVLIDKGVLKQADLDDALAELMRKGE